MFDSDNDNFLDFHEFKVAMRALGFELTKAEVLKILKDLHPSPAGGATTATATNNPAVSPKTLLTQAISFEDFMKVMARMILERDPLEEVRRAFRLFDVDKTGTISFADLKRVAQELGENLDDDELRAMIDEFDFDQDGESKY